MNNNSREKIHSTRQQSKKTTKTTATTVEPKHIRAGKNSGIASAACVRATLRNVIMCGRCVLFFLHLSNVSGRLQIFSCTHKIIWYMSWPACLPVCVCVCTTPSWEPNLCASLNGYLVYLLVCARLFMSFFLFMALSSFVYVGHFMTSADLSDLYDKNSAVPVYVLLYIFSTSPRQPHSSYLQLNFKLKVDQPSKSVPAEKKSTQRQSAKNKTATPESIKTKQMNERRCVCVCAGFFPLCRDKRATLNARASI